MKIDRRLNKYLIIDTETTFDKSVFDIGWLVCDKYENVYVARNYLVQENFTKTYFFKNKRPFYMASIESLKVQILPALEILKILLDDITTYNAIPFAYNSPFDQRVLKGLWNYEIEINDISSYAFNIATQKSYLRENRRTENGHMAMSAESVYQYIIGDNDFEEDHTALSDCYIEMAILLRALRQHKKVNKSITCNNAWRVLDKLYEELGE